MQQVLGTSGAFQRSARLLRGDLIPVGSGLGDQFVQVLPLLFVVGDDTSEPVGQIVAVEGQIELVLVGQPGKNPGLVLLGYVQEALEPVGVGRDRLDFDRRADLGCG